MRTLTLMLAFSLSTLHAQVSVTLQGTTSFQDGIFSSSNANPDPASWKNGIGFAAHVSVPVTKSLFFSPSVEFDQYEFDRYIYNGVWIPEYHPISDRGEDSRVYRFGFELELLSGASPHFAPYVLSGISYIYERIGDIYLYYPDVYDSKPRETKLQNQSRSYFAHSLGVGIKSIVYDNFGFDFGVKYYSNYTDRFHRSVSIGLLYQFD